MNIQVWYHSSTGNTEKLARAMADAVGVEARAIGDGPPVLDGPVDLLLLGDGIYAGKPNRRTVAMIEGLTPAGVKNVAVFGTYGGSDKIGADLQARLRARGLKVVGEPFVRKGQSWALMNRGRPNEEDLRAAAAFAKAQAATVAKG